MRLPCPWDSPGKNTGVGCHFLLQCMKVKSESEVVQSCLTFHDPMDCSLLGSSVHGIFQARVLEWVAIAFSNCPPEQRLNLTPVLFLDFVTESQTSKYINYHSAFNLAHMYTVEKAMAPHSSTLAWKIPWMEEPSRLQSMGSLRVRHD